MPDSRTPATLPLQTLLQQAAALLERGDALRAGSLLQQTLAQYPDAAAAHHAMAQLATRIGQHTLALHHMARAAELAPMAGTLQLAHGCLLAHHGQLQAALPILQRSTELLPDNPEAWYFLGITLARCQRDSEAIEALQRAHALAPASARIRDALGEAQFQGGFPLDALPLLKARATAAPDDIDAILKLGETLSRLQDFAEAEAVFAGALTRHPANPDLWMAAAQAREDSGDRAAADAAYVRALELKPDWAFPLAGLLALQRGKAEASSIERGQRLCAQAATSDRDRALLGYALGKVMDARGHYPEAMQHWDQANAARRRVAGEFDYAALAARVERMLPAFSAEVLASVTASDEERPVFIVGMPRSGTTLTEQILATHPRIHGCGELPDIALIARHLPSRSGSSRIWPHIVDEIAPAQLQQARQRYLAAATRHAPPDTLRLVDKAPMNFYALGLIGLMFPQARIVWCRRDPRDVAISIYGENFSLSERFATRLDGIGQCINLHERLMRHWQGVLANPILELEYERLVTEPEAQSRRLVEFIGLDWDPACLDFHAGERGVQTPSRWQVRQPIHARSVGRWRHYAFALGPLLGVLDGATQVRTDSDADL